MSEAGNQVIDTFTGLPVWVRVVAILGFPTAIACVLLGVLLGWLESPLTKVVSQQAQEIGLLTQVLRQAEVNRTHADSMIEYQNILLRTLCRTYAKEGLQAQCEPRFRGYEEPQPK
jgi:hypothetical protein